MLPINLNRWIEENRHLLKPPVGNRLIWKDREFLIMIVGGPNVRSDFHVNQSEEIFYQLEGDMNLRVNDAGLIKDIPIRAGDLFLLPPGVPHSPQRSVNTVGLVVERRRRPGELDAFLWYCEKCQNEVYRETLFLTDIVSQLPPIFDRYYEKAEHRTCRCGHVNAARPERKEIPGHSPHR